MLHKHYSRWRGKQQYRAGGYCAAGIRRPTVVMSICSKPIFSAGEPGRRRKSKFAGLTNSGSANDRFCVVSGGFPFLERLSSEADVRRARLEVEIVVHGEPVAVPVATQQASRVEIHDAALEEERDVRLRACAHQLVFAVEREDLVAHDVPAGAVCPSCRWSQKAEQV